MLAKLKIGARIYVLVALLLGISLFVYAFSISQMMKIGAEIEQIAEHDMPLTEAITTITVHQLEQAILFERGIAVGQELANNPSKLAHFKEISSAFSSLSHRVDAELTAAEELLRENIAVTNSPKERVEFEHLLTLLVKIDAEHLDYERLAEQTFSLIARGQLSNLGDIALKIEAEEDQINHELEAALKEIGQFTAEALLTAEAHEKSSILIIAIAAVAAVLIGLLFAYFLARSVTKPILHMTGSMSKLAAGDAETEIQGVGRRDEIGTMAEAVQVFRDNMIQNAEMAAEQEKEREAREERARIIERLTGEIDEVVNAAIEGDFTRRLTLEGKEGFTLSLSQAMNSLTETLSVSMEDIATMMDALANGELRKRITNKYKGTFEKLKTDANGTAERLSAIVSEITESSFEISNSAGEIVTGSADLSQRSEQQAANLEETAASMEEISSTVKQNAENAGQANQLAVSARDTADHGGGVVKDAVSAMSKIEESSRKISDIIGVIDEISFQTNLLALNAAVEAARAGEAGKGFAVVASEVRTLAQRSSQAAKDIKALIVDSGSLVTDGVTLVNQTGETLSEIVESIKRVTDIVSEISAASTEQATGIEEIKTAVMQMDEMTQQNSALVEESTTSARSLQERAERMSELMTFFKLDDQNAGQKPKTNSAPRLELGGAGKGNGLKSAAGGGPRPNGGGPRPNGGGPRPSGGGNATPPSPQAVTAVNRDESTGEENWEEF